MTKPNFLGLRITAAQRSRLEWLAQETGTSFSAVVRDLIDGAEIHQIVAPRTTGDGQEDGQQDGRVAA